MSKRIIIYKGFDKEFLSKLQTSPLISNDISDKLDFRKLDDTYKNSIGAQIFDPRTECWVTYEEYEIAHEIFDMFYKSKQIEEAIVIDNNIFPGQKKFLESAANVLRQDEQNPLSPERVFLYFNLNKFKLINIKYGSSFGDAILKDIAELLKNEFPDDLVARFGDDHFVVLATNDEIDEKVENMYSRLRNRHKEDTLDGTVGAYVVKENDIDPYVACNLAKLACEQGRKQAGTVVTYYTEEIGSQIDEQYYIVNHLDEALEKGYIRVYCQPVVRSISGA